MKHRDKRKTLITARFSNEALDYLASSLDISCDGYGFGGIIFSEHELIENVRDVEVLIVELDPVTRKLIEVTPNLKLIGSCRGTPNNVDVAAATDNGIPVLFTPGRNAVSVAELTICMMLMLARNVKPAMNSVVAGNWGDGDESPFIKYRGIELFGKTIGIIGFGAIGKEVMTRAKLLGMKVLAFDPFIAAEKVETLGVKAVSLEFLLESSDFISLHAMPSQDNRGLIGYSEFAIMKDSAYLINTASGSLVDEDALLNALQNQQVAGAGLDVFSSEPFPMDHQVFKFDNVIAVPHIGGATSDVSYHQSMIMAKDIMRFITDQDPHNVFNPEVLE